MFFSFSSFWGNLGTLWFFIQTLYENFKERFLANQARSEVGLAFILFPMPNRSYMPILVLLSQFEQFRVFRSLNVRTKCYGVSIIVKRTSLKPI